MPIEVKKVLIVDDEPDASTGLSRILALDAFDADIAHSVDEALQPRPWSEYVAIILDRRLPDGSAEQLVPEIKKLAPSAAIVIVTGYADLESSIAAIRSGVEDYLFKPINPDALRATLARIVRVREAEERALRAERLAAIGQVVTMMAHESRNYLQRICISLEFLEEIAKDNPAILAEIAHIQAAEQGLERLLEELRQFAAPMKLDKHDCHLRDIWRQAWSQVISAHANGTNARMEDLSDDQDTTCQIDSFRFGQVFRNLFENSLSACGAEPRIKIKCHSGVGSLKITVIDNGPGLSPEARQKVFEPFYTTKTKGTGLGMAIVRRIVEAHGGEIRIDKGSTTGAGFHISLPIACCVKPSSAMTQTP